MFELRAVAVIIGLMWLHRYAHGEPVVDGVLCVMIFVYYLLIERDLAFSR